MVLVLVVLMALVSSGLSCADGMTCMSDIFSYRYLCKR